MANPKYKLSINNTIFQFQEEKEIDGYRFSLEKLSYDKGIYRPAEMSVTMNVGGRDVKYDKLVSAFYMKDVKLEIDGEKVAENYFVFKVKPMFRKVSNGSSVKLELTINSRDKLMTLDKYSKAWSGKKLGIDVFDKEVSSFPFKLQNCRDLQIVDYNSGEFIQPYLVQYNESFYDFMRRTANRCGEFLYHENGKLHLGMKVNDIAKDNDVDYANQASERYYEDILREGMKTSDYAYDYLKDRPEPDGKPYSNPLTYDDYLSDIEPDYTSFGEQMDFVSRNIVGSVCMCLEGTSFAKIVSNFAMTYSFKLGHAKTIETNLNNVQQDVNFAKWAGKDDQKDGEKLRQFGTAKDQKTKSGFGDGEINLNAGFYAMVREAEKKVSENAVYLEFGPRTQKLSIGDKIKVDGVNYIVIGVNGSCVLTYQAMTIPKYEERQQVIGVKLYGDAPIPPALPDIVIRESQPQLAFVTANFDPMKIGRVRIRFAWQPKDGDASPWVRVSLPFATDGGGVKFKPEVDDEVMVSFEEGNIERPYVSGFLLSPRSNNSWSYLPDRGITSKNGHNITFNDGLDGCSFYYSLSPALKAVKSFFPTATWPNLLTDDANHRSLTGGMTISDRYGLYRINLSSDSRSVAIQSAMGDVTLSAFTGITLSAPNGDIKIQGKNVSIEAGDKVVIESGQNVKERFFANDDCYEENGLKWSDRGLKTFKDFGTNLGRSILNRSFNKIIDVQLLRTVLEVVLRPIDGTTKIKSLTFVQIEAGKGSAEYPRTAVKDSAGELAAYDLMPSIQKISSTVGTRVDAIKTAFEQMCDAIEAFNNISGDKGVNRNETVISFNAIKSNSGGNLDFNWDRINLGKIKSEAELQDDYKKAKEDAQGKMPDKKAEEYQGKVGEIKYQKDLAAWKDKMDQIQESYQDAIEFRQNTEIKKKSEIEETSNQLKAFIKVFMDSKTKDFNSEMGQNDNLIYNSDINTVLKSKLSFDYNINITKGIDKTSVNWADLKKHYMRTAVYLLLTDTSVKDKVSTVLNFKSSLKSKDNLQDKGNWESLIDDFVTKPDSKSVIKQVGIAIKDWAVSTYGSPWVDSTVNRKRWRVGLEGKILLSDSSDNTITFDNKGVVKSTENAMFTNKTLDNLKQRLMTIGA